MKYILSNLEITESTVDYILDTIGVFFALESSELPQLNVGVHRRVTNPNKAVVEDSIASDVAKYIGKMGEEGISLSLKSISSRGNKFQITLVYNGEDINFALS